jgi:hypothetical protein
MSKAITDVVFILTLKKYYDNGTIKICDGRSFGFSPKEWKNIVKTGLVPLAMNFTVVEVPVKLFKAEKVTHIEQYIIEKIKI